MTVLTAYDLKPCETVSFSDGHIGSLKTHVDNDFNNPHGFLLLIMTGQLVCRYLLFTVLASPREHVVPSRSVIATG